MYKEFQRLWPRELSDRVVNLNKLEEKLLQLKLQQIEKEKTETIMKKNRQIFKISNELEIIQDLKEAQSKKKNQKTKNFLMKTKSKNGILVEKNEFFQTDISSTVFKKCYTDSALLSNDKTMDISRSKSKSTDDLQNDVNLKTPFMIEKMNLDLELRPNSSNLEKRNPKRADCVVIKKKTFKF